MKRRVIPPKLTPSITIRVSGQLFHGHLPYLSHLVESAAECQLWPVLNLSDLEELDRAALLYLTYGENHDFGIVSCPGFIRERMELEQDRPAA